MSLTADDLKTISAAVNKGIDSRLEACFVPERGDKQIGNKLIFSPESLIVLIRRLLESGEIEQMELASSICFTLEVELI